MAKLPADEIILARKGHATDPKRDAAIQFARKVIETRQVGDADVTAVRDAGCTDANVVEVVALVVEAADIRSCMSAGVEEFCASRSLLE